MPTPISSPTRLPRDGDSYVESFAKGLQVLETLVRAGEALTLSEVARRCTISPAAARRMLATLLHEGYVSQDARVFQSTYKVVSLARAQLAKNSLAEACKPLIEGFTRETGQVCTLACLDGPEVVYLARSARPSPLSRSIGIGDRLPAHATSTGQVLLGRMSPDELESYLLRHQWPALTPHTLTSASALKERVRRVHIDGYALAKEELQIGVFGLAVPVLGLGSGQIEAALTVSCDIAELHQRDIESKLLPLLLNVGEKLGRFC